MTPSKFPKPKIIGEGDKYFFGGRQSGKTEHCIDKFIQHYPNVVMVVTNIRLSDYVLNRIIEKGKFHKFKKFSISKRIIPSTNLRQRLAGFKRDNPFLIWDDVWQWGHDGEDLYPVEHIFSMFDYVTSGNGKFIKEYSRLRKIDLIDEIEKL